MAANDMADDGLIVIFGASGDLTKRKLIPALYDLFVEGMMPERFAVLGSSRSEMSDEAFREHLTPMARKSAHAFDDASWARFIERVRYQPGDSTRSEAFGPLKKRIGEMAQAYGTGENLLFYLSLAPHLYDDTINNIGAAGLVTEGKAWCSLNRLNRPWQRIIVEKPFGHDPDSAAHLNRVLGRNFEEESVYRIDHYLGKETVQNMLVFRFANAIFEPVWNRNYIDHIQVTAAETVGVEGRGGYYDSPGGGAMRDMIQGHLLQLLALVAMEPPVSMRADDIRLEKGKVLLAARAARDDESPLIAVKGQYGPGRIDGVDIPAYRREKGVDPESQNDTYAAFDVRIDNWRWEGVPFYLRSGKAMARKTTEVVINFRRAPHRLFRSTVSGPRITPGNQIILNIQPNEGIRLRFQGKVPGSGMSIRPVVMDFDFCQQFKARPREAYSTLLLDAMRGDQTLFKNREETESAWRIVQPVLDYWTAHPSDDLPNYAAGTWGPADADRMLAHHGREWHNE
ncbi:MAG: glucose-6-phosphate dehydrogenase [Phycisphaeraceae bacterium]|nr:glucose-6-phosphate dehydrogenase [Phycisphaeraceae bacterium]